MKSANYEEGTFMVWDVESWKKVPRDMKVDYAKLEPPYQSVSEKYSHMTSKVINI